MVDKQLGDSLADSFRWQGLAGVACGTRRQTAGVKGKLMVRMAASKLTSNIIYKFWFVLSDIASSSGLVSFFGTLCTL